MKKTTKTAMEIGAGAAATAAAAGYYFYMSKKAKTHRKIAAKWANDMKKEVMREVKRLPESSSGAFDAIVDRVARTYESVNSVDMQEVRRAASELKANWDKLQREVNRTARRGATKAKSTVKRAVKKVAKKAAKKSAKKRV